MNIPINTQLNIQKAQQQQQQQQQVQQQMSSQQQQQPQYITIKQPQAPKTNIHDLIKSVQDRIRDMGSGPFSPEQQHSYDKLHEILHKAQDSLQSQQQQLKVMQLQQQQQQQQQLQQQQQQQQQQQHHIIQTNIQQTPTIQIIQQPTQQQQLQHVQHVHNISPQQQVHLQSHPITQQQQHQLQQNISLQQQHQPTIISQPIVQQQHQQLQQQKPPTPQPPQSQTPTQQPQPQQSQQAQQAAHATAATQSNQVLEKRALQDLVKEIDPSEILDEDVEDMLLQIADDFIDNVINSSCQLAKHRKSNILEVKDVQFHLERNWNIWIPGFGSDEIKPFKKSYSTEAHKQRLQLIKKSNKSGDAKDKVKE